MSPSSPEDDLIDLAVGLRDTPAAEDGRLLLVGGLERVLVDRERFPRYLARLSLRAEADAAAGVLTPDEMEAAVERGLGALNAASLARLALAPVALLALRDRIRAARDVEKSLEKAEKRPPPGRQGRVSASSGAPAPEAADELDGWLRRI